MIDILGRYLQRQLSSLEFAQFTAGVVKIAEYKDEQGRLMRIPVSCDVDTSQCNQKNHYPLVPDSSKSSIMYIENNDIRVTTKKGNRYELDLDFNVVIWYNKDRLVYPLNKQPYICDDRSRFVGALMNKVSGINISEEGVDFSHIEITDIIYDDIFRRYTYPDDTAQFLMNPYGAVAVRAKSKCTVSGACFEQWSKDSPGCPTPGSTGGGSSSPGVCDPVIIYQTDGTTVYQTISAGGTFTLVGATVNNSSGAIGTLEDGDSITIGDVTIYESDGTTPVTTIIPTEAAQSFNLSGVELQDSGSSTLATLEDGATQVLGDYVVYQSNGTTEVVRLTATLAGGSHTLSGAVVNNSAGSPLTTLEDGQDIDVGDVIIYQPDGTTVVSTILATIAGSSHTLSGSTLEDSASAALATLDDGQTQTLQDYIVYQSDGSTPVHTFTAKLAGDSHTLSGVTVNDYGTPYTLEDGEVYNVWRNGWSVQLDGVNQYAAVTSVTDFNFEYADAMSVQFWVRNDGLAFAPYITNYNTSTTQGWRIFRNGSGSSRGGLTFVIANGSIGYQVDTSSTSLITAGLWSHVVFTKPANNNASNGKFYVDGVAVSVSAATTGGTGSFTHNDCLHLGINSNLLGSTLDARFDSLSIYDVELSAAQVTTIYNNGRPFDRSGDSNMIGYWRFENDFTDETGSNDLTGYNSPTFSRQRP